MAYQSKYTGLQIDDILDSVEYKQDQIEDLESIRAGAAKGATALQSYTEKYTGTVTGIKINGTVKSGSGVIDLGTITTVTENTVSGWGFTKNTGTYSKPSGGIPKTDLASAVQTSLGKADTALQSYTEQYKGTVTGIKINGETKSPANGIVDLGTINESTNDYTFTEVSGDGGYYVKAEIGDTGNPYYDNVYIPLLERDASTPNAPTTRIGSCSGFFTSDNELRLSSDGLQCSSVYANGPNFTITSNGDGKQFLCNNGKYKELKTINGQSLIGSGDITISGGSSNANVQAVDTGDVIDDVNVDYATKTYVDGLVGDINSILESIING